MAEDERGRSGSGATAGALIGALHLAGFAATSALLGDVAHRLPGFEASGLAERLARAGEAQAGGGGGLGAIGAIGAWIRLLAREAVVPAAAEELLFRGVLFASLRRFGGRQVAILASAALFGIAHGDLHHGLVAGLLGISLGCLRERHGLALAVGAHALNNALALAAPSGSLLFGQGEGLGGAIGPALGLVLAGSSNAILLQGLRRGARADGRGAAATSGDASG